MEILIVRVYGRGHDEFALVIHYNQTPISTRVLTGISVFDIARSINAIGFSTQITSCTRSEVKVKYGFDLKSIEGL